MIVARVRQMKQFDLNQGRQITDKKLYYNVGDVPVLTGNNEIKGYWHRASVTKKDLPCITYPTKGNSGVCYVQKSIFDVNNTAILIPRKKYRETMDLNYVAFHLSKLFPKITTSRKGVSYLNREIVEKIDLSLPSKEIQLERYKAISKIINLRRKLSSVLKEIQLVKSRTLTNPYKKYQAKSVPISDILDGMSGNSGLTEKFLYSQIQKEEKREYLVLSGSTGFESPQYIHKCTHPKRTRELINVIENKEIIHIIRKGSAGHSTYFSKGKFTANDDACLLYRNGKTEYEVNLRWLALHMRPVFLDYSSGSDNGTWNRTSFFENVCIDIPAIDEQNNVDLQYSKLEKIYTRIKKIKKDVDAVFQKDIV